MRRKRIAYRRRVFSMSHELRRIELRNATPPIEARKDDTHLAGMIAQSNDHDASNPHGRCFGTMGCFLISLLGGVKSGRARIFDIGRGDGGCYFSVHFPPNCGVGNGSGYIDLIPNTHHMRCGKLVGDTLARDLKDWRGFHIPSPR